MVSDFVYPLRDRSAGSPDLLIVTAKFCGRSGLKKIRHWPNSHWVRHVEHRHYPLCRKSRPAYRKCRPGCRKNIAKPSERAESESCDPLPLAYRHRRDLESVQAGDALQTRPLAIPDDDDRPPNE
jgi:hypothetical protein